MERESSRAPEPPSRILPIIFKWWPMNLPRQILSDFLSMRGSDPAPSLTQLQAQELATLYVESAYLGAALEFMTEQFWLRKKKDLKSRDESAYGLFLKSLFATSLASISCYQEVFLASKEEESKELSRLIEHCTSQVISHLKNRTKADQKQFLQASLAQMITYFLQEEDAKNQPPSESTFLGPRLYRTFDDLDLVFELDYDLEKTQKPTKSPERLYIGSGVGVQSGYSTILLAIHHLDLLGAQKVIDLGSGYGRVGLVFSLMRPDIAFRGYEYVSHRVEIANQSAQSLNLEKNLTFSQQDIAAKNFQIPLADVYYLYDPFTDATYDHVLAQILALSKKNQIRVITKGNARNRLLDLQKTQAWQEPERYDDGNLCIFKLYDKLLEPKRPAQL